MIQVVNDNVSHGTHFILNVRFEVTIRISYCLHLVYCSFFYVHYSMQNTVITILNWLGNKWHLSPTENSRNEIDLMFSVGTRSLWLIEEEKKVLNKKYGLLTLLREVILQVWYHGRSFGYIRKLILSMRSRYQVAFNVRVVHYISVASDVITVSILPCGS